MLCITVAKCTDLADGQDTHQYWTISLWGLQYSAKSRPRASPCDPPRKGPRGPPRHPPRMIIQAICPKEGVVNFLVNFPVNFSFTPLSWVMILVFWVGREFSGEFFSDFFNVVFIGKYSSQHPPNWVKEKFTKKITRKFTTHIRKIHGPPEIPKSAPK